MAEQDLRFPIGKFQVPGELGAAERRAMIDHIQAAPARIRAAVAGLKEQQLDAPYRPGGWTIRQVVHHLPDSHMNSYIRFRWALTEDAPTIKAYHEDRWAELFDARVSPISPSLDLFEALHARWVSLLGSLAESDWKRTYVHPELGPRNLEQTLALYAWHGRHHETHITALRERMGWK
jgi:hypothetical protein